MRDRLLEHALPAGVDPKSVLCEYFKAGQCTKGFKCKYSHDLDIGRKTQKIDLFTDKCACWGLEAWLALGPHLLIS